MKIVFKNITTPDKDEQGNIIYDGWRVHLLPQFFIQKNNTTNNYSEKYVVYIGLWFWWIFIKIGKSKF